VSVWHRALFDPHSHSPPVHVPVQHCSPRLQDSFAVLHVHVLEEQIVEQHSFGALPDAQDSA
jgi:hypothetical protein